jgi:predicted RNA-binding protein with EMAP domain
MEIRERARLLVSERLLSICYMDIDTVPDNAQICEIVDEVEEMIKDDAPNRDISQFLRDNINDNTIEDLIL